MAVERDVNRTSIQHTSTTAAQQQVEAWTARTFVRSIRIRTRVLTW